MEEKYTICQECKATVKAKERHTYSHCLIAKAYPKEWRDIIKQVSGGGER